MRAEIEAWKDMRFGMFIHWGLYALLGRGEWAMYNEAIDQDEYRSLMDRFSAERYDARAWARVAKAAGMKYMVLTTRHHDGFSLWDSPASRGRFDAMHAAAHRDFVKEYVEACRSEGLKAGFYYSPMDWRFPGYFFPRMYRRSAEDMRAQCFEQIRELLTNYGKIDVFWFDGGEDYWLCHGRNLHVQDDGTDFRLKPQCPGFWHAGELDAMIRNLQPGIVINNRYGNREYGDYLTPEGYAGEFNVREPWETSMTLNDSWGWVPNCPPRSLRECLVLLCRCATGDGNLLLNIGPRPDGTMEAEQITRLEEIGAWLTQYGESIYGTRGGPWRNDDMGGMTWRNNTLYVHIWDWKRNTVRLPRFDADPMEIAALTTDSLHWAKEEGHIALSVDAAARSMPVTVIRLTFHTSVDKMQSEGLWQDVPPAQTGSAALIVEEQ